MASGSLQIRKQGSFVNLLEPVFLLTEAIISPPLTTNLCLRGNASQTL